MIPIKWIFIRWFFKYSSPILNIYEKKAIRKYASLESNFSPVFIIGSPRSGSTIIFQLITKYFDFTYINNFVDLAREVPFTGFLINKRFFGSKKHSSFKSNFGKTKEGGLLAPNEGLFWYKWLPKDKHYVLPGEINEMDKQSFKDCINAIMNLYKKPIVIKNLSFSVRLELIKEIFPNARLVYVKRDIIDIVQSIIKAKIDVFGELNNKWWSIKPKNYKSLLNLDPVEQIVKQVYYIEKQIYFDLKGFRKADILEIEYGDLADTKMVLEKTYDFLNLDQSLEYKLPEIKISNKRKVSKELYDIILKEINDLNWKNFKD